MDAIILNEKLESLQKCIQRLQDKRTPDITQLQADIDRQDIIALNLSRAVQVCVDIASHIIATTQENAPATMGEAFVGLEHLGVITPELTQRMQSAVGFRNIAVHSYQAIDWEIVHAIIWQHLDEFRHFASAVSAYMDQ